MTRASTLLDAGDRLAGVDLARGLAVLGMLTAHLATTEELRWADPDTWSGIVDGRSSILFALLAGVSIALLSGGRSPVGGDRLRLVRGRLAARALVLWVLGAALILTGVPVFVILPAYALLFLLALPLLRWRPLALWALAGAAALIMPLLQPGLDEVVALAGPDVGLVLGWHYPFTVWISFVAAGMAVGRSRLTALRTQLVLLAGGIGAAAVGYGAAAWGSAAGVAREGWAAAVWSAAPHSVGIPEVIGSGGFAVAVLGASLLVCRTFVRWVAFPIRAVGSMPLTAYVGQLVAWAIVASLVLGDTGDLGGFRALDPLGPFVWTTLALCTAWALLWGRGPLERVTAWAAAVVVRP